MILPIMLNFETNGIMSTIPSAVLEALLRVTGGTVVLDGSDLVRNTRATIVCIEQKDPYRLIFKLEEIE